MPFVKGQVANPRGRPKGTQNKVTKAAREFFATFLEANHDKAQALWEQVAAEDPGKALALLWDASERVVPKLGRLEHVGENGGPILFQIRDPDDAA